ncbi:MAG TPA: TetR/AcrR family transcriptional regulator [Acidimicrobiales bacterium]|nr:TetR/AcrR family transcriptional regulator [Acidimicrobiales bacterium]
MATAPTTGSATGSGTGSTAAAGPVARATRPSADATRQRILAAALDLFADRSYDGASTRDIAQRAGVSQPSVNYHFRTKHELWCAAVDGLFDELDAAMRARLDGLRGVDDLTRAELMVREFIAFSASHPQLHRIITQESKTDGERVDWLVERHVRPLYEMTAGLFERLVEQGVLPDVPVPILYYILTGAGPTIFVLAPECRRLAGFDPLTPEAVQAHADAVVNLLFGYR